MEHVQFDPRLRLIAAAVGLADTPAARALCERFTEEARRVGEAPPTPAAPLFDTGIVTALAGISHGLTIAADHAEFIAERAKLFTFSAPSPTPRPWPPAR